MSSQAPYPRPKLCYDEASVRSNKSSRHTALLTWLLAAFCSAWEVSENTLVTWELVRSCYTLDTVNVNTVDILSNHPHNYIFQVPKHGK